MITVAKDNSGDFDSIQKAVDSVSDNNNETIFIKKGIYKERIEIRKNNITLIGEDTDETIITEGFYARMIMPDRHYHQIRRCFRILYCLQRNYWHIQEMYRNKKSRA